MMSDITLSNYYHSPEGVFPLDEFMYWVTDKEIIIYNRLACRLIAVGINSFTMDEIKWIDLVSVVILVTEILGDFSIIKSSIILNSSDDIKFIYYG